MKILHLSNVIGEHKGGGVHEVVTNFYRYQKELKHEPHIWYPGSEEDSNFIRHDVNIQGLPTFGNSKYGLIKSILHSVPKDIAKFDIIHQHGIWMPMSIYVQIIKKKSKLKSVLQPHGYLNPYARGISKYKKLLAYYLFEKSNIINASVLVGCSEDEALILKTMFPDKYIAVIPNGVSLDFFNSSFPIEYKFKAKYRMLFLSQINPIKGLERLLRVIASIGKDKFKDWELIIAGYEELSHKRFLTDLINILELTNFAKFVGPKLGQDKIELLDNSDLFILPSFSENFGIVVAEALARKIPVLTTRGTPWKELNTMNCGFWVDNSEEGIKKGLLKMLETSEKELKEMGDRGRELVGSKYLWSQTTLKTIELYKWIIDGGTRPDFII